MAKKLPSEEFSQLVKNAPLVSIDLVVWTNEGKLLVGCRKNEPAKDWWFVPGGRVFKEEKIKHAFERLTQEELGRSFPFEKAVCLGVFEHFYDTNGAGLPGVGTHYVVIAYEIHLECDFPLNSLPQTQHREYKFLFGLDALDDNAVHGNTKEYLRLDAIRNDEQYSVIANRRTARDAMLWQTPMLIFTAEAFLFTVISQNKSTSYMRLLVSILGASIAFAACQLFVRHRELELQDSLSLEKYEADNRHKGYALQHANNKSKFFTTLCYEPIRELARMPSHYLWTTLLCLNFVIFLVLACYSIYQIFFKN